jgi:hypothetical protein
MGRCGRLWSSSGRIWGQASPRVEFELPSSMPGLYGLWSVEMRSDWGNKLGKVRGWLMGAAVVVIGLVYLLRR